MENNRDQVTPRVGDFGELRLCLLGVITGLLVIGSFQVQGQSASVLYTWDNTGNASPNIESWIRGFGAAGTSAVLDNSVPGELTITETSTTPGATQAFSDGFNRVRESSTASSGGLDLTGLDYLEFDLGHNGAGNIAVQVFVQATPSSTFVALGPDLSVAPGVNTYQVPITGLAAAQAVYIRTIGLNVRDHAALGNVTWTLREVRSGGVPLSSRTLITHDTGTPEGGLQGAIVNFDNAAVQLNNGGQNQTGLSHDSTGSGSLEWIDLGTQNGAAISWGNGTAWNGNTFNNRATDLSNYEIMVVRMSALDPDSGGGTLGVTAFFQKNNFQFQAAEAGAARSLPIDGEFHDLQFSLAGLTNMNVVDLTGINLLSHPQDLIINVDSVHFEQIPIAPALSVTLTTTNTIVVSWPSPSTGFVLQQTMPTLANPDWNEVTTIPSDDGTTKSIIIDQPAGSAFYRLFKP